jgi:hypothetical protein
VIEVDGTVIRRRAARCVFRVQRVMMSSSKESWTVLEPRGGPVEPIECHPAYLSDVERSPNTVKAYAHDLKDWFAFLGIRGPDRCEVRLRTSASLSWGHGCWLGTRH